MSGGVQESGVLYGLTKIHKALADGIPSCRPILSAIGTPTPVQTS